LSCLLQGGWNASRSEKYSDQAPSARARYDYMIRRDSAVVLVSGGIVECGSPWRANTSTLFSLPIELELTVTSIDWEYVAVTEYGTYATDNSWCSFAMLTRCYPPYSLLHSNDSGIRSFRKVWFKDGAACSSLSRIQPSWHLEPQRTAFPTCQLFSLSVGRKKYMCSAAISHSHCSRQEETMRQCAVSQSLLPAVAVGVTARIGLLLLNSYHFGNLNTDRLLWRRAGVGISRKLRSYSSWASHSHLFLREQLTKPICSNLGLPRCLRCLLERVRIQFFRFNLLLSLIVFVK
jgi:hypothetical protein